MSNFIRLALLIVFSISICSCYTPEGVEVGSSSVDLNFKEIKLSYDFSTIVDIHTASQNPYFYKFMDDCDEFSLAHSVDGTSRYSGRIEWLSHITSHEYLYPDDRKPSITIELIDNKGETIRQNVESYNVLSKRICDIPKVDKVVKATITVKSIKTKNYGIQVVWTKTAEESGWPINEFVSDGSVSCANTSIVKVGSKAEGVFARLSNIISNTATTGSESSRYIKDDDSLLPPHLQRSVMIRRATKATEPNNVVWSAPTYYKAI